MSDKAIKLESLDFKIYEAILAAHDLKEYTIVRKLFDALDAVRELKQAEEGR